MGSKKSVLTYGLLLLMMSVVVFGGCDRGPAPTTDTLYSQEEIDYFLEIALGSEFGSGTQRIRKWTSDVLIDVQGEPTDEDVRTLQQVIDDLNGLTDGVELHRDAGAPNITIHFAPADEFAGLEPNYVPGNLGFFWVNWTSSSEIYRAIVLITTEGVSQQERSPLIREELTQSLGLMRDSNRYPESIFFQAWTDVTDYTDLDRSVIEILHRSDIRPNMTRQQVLSVLEAVTE